MSDTPQQGAAESPREYYMRRHAALDAEYSSWRTLQQEVMDNLQPYRGRFSDGEQNRGFRKDRLLINDAGINAQKKLKAFEQTGITNATRKWLRLGTSDPQKAEQHGNRVYLDTVETLAFQIFAGSNFYKVIPELYADINGPATGVMWFEPDPRTVIRFQHFPVGTYRLGANDRGEVDTLTRRFSMTVIQMVSKFGLENCSKPVQDAYRDRNYEQWHQVQHTVEPRGRRDKERLDTKNMPWASVWLEVGQGDQSGGSLGLLKESGFPIKPFVCGRWAVVGEDVYGLESPGIQTIGMDRGLQSLEFASATQIALAGDPPLNVSNENASIAPGARNRLPGTQAAGGHEVKPTYVPDPAHVQMVAMEKDRYERRINRAHFVDILLAISGDERAQRATAEEIRAGQQERLLQLGGMFENLSTDVLSPVVNAVLYYGQMQGKIPRPPADLGGVEVQYLSILSAAQKTIGIQSVERFANSVIGIATQAQRPDVLDKIDLDEVVDTMADMLAVKPSLVRADEQVAQLRQQRADAQKAQQQGAAMSQAASGVKDLSQADPENLQELLRQFGPAASAAAQA